MGKDRGGSVAAGCGSLVRDSSSGQALTKQKQKKGVPGRGGVDESTKLGVNLTSNHSSIEKFSEAGEGRLAAAGENERRREMLRKR